MFAFLGGNRKNQINFPEMSFTGMLLRIVSGIPPMISGTEILTKAITVQASVCFAVLQDTLILAGSP
jgi:hypothetical protein